jgi:SAM-dependent methyltransferase
MQEILTAIKEEKASEQSSKSLSSSSPPYKTPEQITDEDYKVAPTSADNVVVSNRGFPDWQNLYAMGESNVEKLPWFSKELDLDLRQELANRNIKTGRFLDLGTGPATQALELSKLGFDVTATDISESAIARAKKLLPREIRFVVDDILESKLEDNQFNYIFDRGCFHVLDPIDRPKYIKKIKSLLVSRGLLFLKTFSVKEPSSYGPHKFSPEMIEQLFSTDFEMLNSRETVFQGTLPILPKALFAIMRKKEVKN